MNCHNMMVHFLMQIILH